MAITAISIEYSFNFNPFLAYLKIGVKLGVGPQLWSFLKEKLGWGWVGVSFQHFWGLGLGWGGCFRKKIGLVLGIGCFVIEKLGCGWCCGVFHEKNWVGLGVSNCKKNWVGVVVGGCGQLKLGMGFGLGVAFHGLIGLGVPKPHFAHPCHKHNQWE